MSDYSPTLPEPDQEPDRWDTIGQPVVSQSIYRWLPDIYDQLRWTNKPRNRAERRAEAARKRRK